MGTKRRELIEKIQVNEANLKHIAEFGHINGSLLVSIEHAMAEYAKYLLQKAAQNAKVKSTLHDKGLNRSEIFVVDKESITSIELD